MSLEATAYHEAGHMVAAWRQRVKIRSATIVQGDGYLGKMEHDNPLKGIRLDIDGSQRAYLKGEKAIRICLAGPAAQRRYNPRSWRAHHGAADFNVASSLALRLQGSGELANAYLRWLGISVRAAIGHDWTFVEWFAKHLLEKGTLQNRDIPAIITEIANSRYYSGSPPALRVIEEHP